MNILLINHYAGAPAYGMEFRPYYLAREWVRQGHQVEIVACATSHVRARTPDMQGGVERVEMIEGIRYRWMAAPAYRGNGVGRVVNIATFLARTWARGGRLIRENRPDLIIASSTYPMDIWLARHLARRASCRWVYEVHDLWPLSLIELSGMSPRHPFAVLCAWAERSAYRTADAVVSMLPQVHHHMASLGLDLRKLRIVPNGVDVDEWLEPPPPLASAVQAELDAARRDGCATIGYAGSMGLPNALDTLLDAAHLLRPQALRLILVGDGHERQRLVQRVRDEGLHQVRFLPPIPKAQIPAFLRQLDIAFIGWQPMPLYRFGIAPNKLMDYMMAGCPVLHAVQAGNDPVTEAGCGVTVPPGDPQAIASGLLDLLGRPETERRAMGLAGQAHVRAHHAYSVLARRFLEPMS